MSYVPHQSFIAPARNSCQIWRTLAGIVLCFSVYAMGLSTFSPLFLEAPTLPSGDSTPTLVQSVFTPAAALAILFSFGFITLGAAITVIVLHGRSPLTLLGDPRQTIRYFRRAIAAVIILNFSLMVLPPYGGGAEMVENLPAQTWFLLLPISLTALLVQTSAEEIFFRGYVQQQLAARFSSPVIWMGIPAIVFALGHYDQANGANAWSIVAWAALFSIAASDLVARTGNLGAAIGLHLVNNAFGMLIVSYPGAMSGLSLFVLSEGPREFGPTSVEILIEYAMLGVSWLAIRLAVRR